MVQPESKCLCTKSLRGTRRHVVRPTGRTSGAMAGADHMMDEAERRAGDRLTHTLKLDVDTLTTRQWGGT